MTLMAQPFPELDSSLGNFGRDYPSPFTYALMMPFVDTSLHGEIVGTIKTVFAAHGISVLRADDKCYSDDFLLNIRTYMHGCRLGIAVLEQLTSEFYYPNVSLGVGYMLALGKPLLILKDTALPAANTDLAERLYKPFDIQHPRDTLPSIIEKWLRDKSLP